MKKNTKPQSATINVRILQEKGDKIEIKTPTGTAWVVKAKYLK